MQGNMEFRKNLSCTFKKKEVMLGLINAKKKKKSMNKSLFEKTNS